MPTKTIPITAYYLARSIDLAQFAERVPYALTNKTRNRSVFTVSEDQWFIIYGFGVVVLVNLGKDFLKKLLTKKVQQCCTSMIPERYSEDYPIVVDPDLEKEVAEYDAVKMKSFSMERLEIVAEIIAQSVAIDVFDGLVDGMLQRFSERTTELEQRGRIRARTHTILKLIGENYSILEAMVVRISLLDKPETVWDDPQLETLYLSLRSMFELQDRFTNLDYKLRFLQSNSELMLETLRGRREQFLEIIIIMLIAFEIVIFLYEVFWR